MNDEHPADAEAWKMMDSLYPDFSLENLNIRLGLAADGFNPFRTMDLTLLKYWGDEEVQALANDNSERRCSMTDTHTMDPKSLAQVKNKMKKCDPKQGTPSDVNMKKLTSGNQAEADAMVSHDKERSRNWLVGRGGKSSGTKVHASLSHYVDELTTKIKLDLETELEAKVNKKVQENLTWALKKLGDANPDLKVDIGEFCATMSSEDDNGTPMTQGGPTS
ncbi:hypothetical protein OROHE_014864 [Orobanche hederae]